MSVSAISGPFVAVGTVHILYVKVLCANDDGVGAVVSAVSSMQVATGLNIK
jgi:hypothetical protein